MSLTPEDKVFVLQRFVNSYAKDLVTMLQALADPSTPDEAQRLIIGGLNYALDKFDMLPDHRGPIGIADDAIILRVSAKVARTKGAKHAGLEPLALDANNVHNLFEDLATPLEKFILTLPKKEVRGRNADKILTHNLSRAAFEGDVNGEAKKFIPDRIATSADAPRVIGELYRAMRDTMVRAKVYK